MLITGIKSKPVYAPLSADVQGRYHLMLGMDADGRLAAAALERVCFELQRADPLAMQRTRVLCVAGSAAPASHPELLEHRTFVHMAALLDEFRRRLEHSLMGTRLYVAGPESFIGLAMKIALEFNMNKDEIRAEEMGSRARRVYCVHCRSVADEVRTNIARCAGCARWLLVRDHYSRRLAAYMGVMIDAEVPGELPAIQEIYV